MKLDTLIYSLNRHAKNEREKYRNGEPSCSTKLYEMKYAVLENLCEPTCIHRFVQKGQLITINKSDYKNPERYERKKKTLSNINRETSDSVTYWHEYKEPKVKYYLFYDFNWCAAHVPITDPTVYDLQIVEPTRDFQAIKVTDESTLIPIDECVRLVNDLLGTAYAVH